jgi:hypothetical protein
MLDMIKANAVPANLMAAAAHGSLSMPAVETLQVLVHLTQNRVFGKQARLTLAAWDLEAAQAAVADPSVPPEIIGYFLNLDNIRPKLLPNLIENPAVAEDALLILAAEGSRDVVRAMLASPRIRASHKLLHPLSLNVHLDEKESQQVQTWLAGTELRVVGGTESGIAPCAPQSSGDTDVDSSEEAQAALTAFEREHAAELASTADAPFHPIGGTYGLEIAETGASAPEVPTQAVPAPAAAAAPARAKIKSAPDPKARESVLQKISRLDVKGRVQLAVRGTKEERAILVRDGTKLVALAVLQSPKISDGEVEKFAGQKNVLENLLRGITMHRRFMKNYIIIRNLTANPRTPIDVSLGLVKHLIPLDLKNLSNNKDVSETIRKMALRAFKQKADPSKKN